MGREKDQEERGTRTEPRQLRIRVGVGGAKLCLGAHTVL